MAIMSYYAVKSNLAVGRAFDSAPQVFSKFMRI